MAGGTKERLDRLEEMQARFDSVLGSFAEEAAPSKPVCARLVDLDIHGLEMRRSVEALALKVQSLSDELRALKDARTLGGVGERGTVIKFPEPSSFNGAREAKELENFLWDMNQYLIAAKIPENEQVALVGMYLSGDAKLWWRSRQIDDARVGRKTFSSWEELKKELRDQFLPCNTAWVARVALKALRQTGTVREYVKEFTSLMLDITDMSKEDQLFNFLSGLEPWAQTELQRQGVKDLPTAIARAEALVDYRDDPADKGKSRLWKPDVRRDFPREPAGVKARDTKAREASVETKQEGSTRPGCFICDGPHRARECPKRGNLAALLLAEASEDESDVCLSPLQLREM